MEKKLQRPTGIESSYFVRIKGSDTYIHYRDRKYIFKATIRGACMFETSFAEEFIKADDEYELEKVLVKDALIT
jgi:hypothetical protein